MKKPTLKTSVMNADNVENVSLMQKICEHMKRPTVERSVMNASSVESFKVKRSLLAPAKQCSNERNISTGVSFEISPDHDNTFSCWICQEELSSQALLLQHYENHMN